MSPGGGLRGTDGDLPDSLEVSAASAARRAPRMIWQHATLD